MKRLTRLLSRSTAVKSQNSTVPVAKIDTGSIAGVQFLDLPPEILLIVSSEYLYYENVIALSLTCHQLYELLFYICKPSKQHHGREAALLRLLERDRPEWLSCSVHERLYDWSKQKAKRYHCPQCTESKRGSLQGSLVICNKGCRQSFYGMFESERRLVLRHSLLGPQYGISIRTLNHVCKKSHSKRANEVRPKIVSGSLLLWRTHHRTLPLDMPSPNDPESIYAGEAICLHHERALSVLLLAAVCHAKRAKAELPSYGYNHALLLFPASWLCPLLFKCDQCATDVRLRVDMTQSNEAVIRLDAYQDLGSLFELTTAQKQVLGVKHDWQTQYLSRQEKLELFVNIIELKYHQSQTDGLTKSISQTDVTFLSEWTFNSRSNANQLITFRPEPNLVGTRQPQPNWQTIPFYTA